MIWHGEQLIARTREGAMRGVVAGISIVEEHWVNLVTSGSRSGRVYRRRGVEHRASAPGEPPASDTGTLVNSREVHLIPDQLAARMTITAAYAPHLEYGTRNIEPRPSARRALAEKTDEVQSAITFEIAQALS